MCQKQSFLTHPVIEITLLIIFCKMKLIVFISKKHTIIFPSPRSYLIDILFLICTSIIIVFQVFCTCWLFSLFQKRKVAQSTFIYQRNASLPFPNCITCEKESTQLNYPMTNAALPLFWASISSINQLKSF